MDAELEGHSVSSVRISSDQHRVRVIAEQRPGVVVEGSAEVTHDGGTVTIGSVSSALTVRVPEGVSVVVGSRSGRVSISGAAGNVAVITESGRIEIDHAASVDARTSSARITLGRCDGECRIRTESGRIEVGSCCGADVSTSSGRISISQVDGPVRAHCVSGRIDIAMDSAHDIDAETVSGRVAVSLPHGVDAWQPTGPADSAPAPAGSDCVVRVRSGSGRVDVSSR